ncbi:MAG: sulfite exporter TauE/SafE family protein [Lentimicrobiaceae bacterium]|nr:sulfite exporter TauE/SafE family protein [Lentimicrobiaceae bacterium]
MNISTILILLVIGLAAGVFGGMVGLGGGVIMIPAMIYFLGVDQYTAQGTSLAVMLPPVGLFAVYNYYKAGSCDLRYALIIALAFIIGGYFGSKISLNIPIATMKKIFAVALILIAVNMLIKK